MFGMSFFLFSFFFTDPAPPEIYTLSLHDALPICSFPSFATYSAAIRSSSTEAEGPRLSRSEEHTSELQSRRDLVCRLLLEKKKKKIRTTNLKKKKKKKKTEKKQLKHK